MRYKTFRAGENSASDELLVHVSDFVNNQTDSIEFLGSWMLVVTWDRLQEFKRVDDPMLSSSVSLRLFMWVLIFEWLIFIQCGVV